MWFAMTERYKKTNKHADTAVMDSLALFGLKQASFYEVGHRLNKRMNMSRTSRNKNIPCISLLSRALQATVQSDKCFTL